MYEAWKSLDKMEGPQAERLFAQKVQSLMPPLPADETKPAWLEWLPDYWFDEDGRVCGAVCASERLGGDDSDPPTRKWC